MIKQVNPADRLKGSLSLPADKSISHRSVMFAALHNGRSIISNFSEAADPHSTLDCLRALGVSLKVNENVVEIEGVGREGLKEPKEELNCGNSGTTMRLLSGIIAGSGVPARMIGDDSLSSRTMSRIIEPLSRMGAFIDARENNYAPLTFIRTQKLKPLHFKLPIPSAQLKSCILLAGLFGDEPTQVIETLPSRDHTERLLDLSIDYKDDQTVITSSRRDSIPSQTYQIPNDFSAAAFWLVAGSIHSSAEIELKDVGINPTRTGALDILRKMGADIRVENKRKEGPEPIADLTVSSTTLKPLHITEEVVPNCIDELPILAVAMLFAEGTSRISGAGELRHKETDRLNAVADILTNAGADFTEYSDGFEIRGNPDFTPDSSTFESYHDHRIAMSAAVLGLLAASPSQVTGAGCTAISYPSFWKDVVTLTK